MHELQTLTTKVWLTMDWKEEPRGCRRSPAADDCVLLNLSHYVHSFNASRPPYNSCCRFVVQFLENALCSVIAALHG